ncbi:phage tail protein [Pseudomonas sp. COW5]|uniref:phage tail protein n=1 Tax=Pseudomonas sp. COW5 TaxID=2981253 RepID=UPI0022475CE0|nr:phage tail protein [Pseudomonas sp. COW5]MCX2542221.1 phage tail protein [Pseudomonas sp. COW5]
MIVIQELHQIDGELRPAQPSATHDWDGEQWVVNPEKVALLEQQETARLCARVDAAADSARSVLAGDPLKALEYAQAVLDAQAFQDAGYPKKEVPLSVAAWVAKGRSAKQAAEQILDKGAQVSDSLLTLRTLRLKAKTRIREYASKNQLEQARAATDEVLLAIRGLTDNTNP